jgi:hypothetical protein
MNNLTSATHTHSPETCLEINPGKNKHNSANITTKSFTSVDLWNIQRIGRSRAGRRYL